MNNIIERLHSSAVGLDEIQQLLSHPYSIVRGNALLALAKKIDRQPEIGTNSNLINNLHKVAENPENDQPRLIGPTSVAHLAIVILLKAASNDGNAVGRTLKEALPELEQKHVDWLLQRWNEIAR